MTLQLQVELCIRVAVAVILSSLVGLERERSGQSAGLRTHMLVGLGAALFTVLSTFAFEEGDRGRVAAQIVTGIGFLGAGAIIQRRNSKYPHGLTTAAGIWAVAAIGMASGVGAYALAAFSAVLMIFVLGVLARVSDRINPRVNPDGTPKASSHVDPENVDDDDAGADEIDEMHRNTGGKEQQLR